MMGLAIDGIRPRIVPATGNWIGLWFAIECDYCKGKRMPHGLDDRTQEQVDAGQMWVDPFRGDPDVGVVLAVLGHVAFQHSTLPVREMEYPATPLPSIDVNLN